MPLRLIIGRSNVGKTRFMYDTIKNLESDGKNCIVFVPNFARVVAEEEYFKYTKKLGMINTKITTLKRYAEQNVDKNMVYMNKEYLPEMSKKYIVKKCILDNDEMFDVFKKVKNTQGFADKLYKFISAFESENLTKDKVEQIILKDNFLSHKFKEIYNLHEIIKSQTKERFVTSLDILDIYTNGLIQNNKLKEDIDFFFDYYNNFNGKELEYIKMLLILGKNVTITLDLDMENKDLSDIFDVSYDTYRKLVAIAKDVECNIEEVNLSGNQNLCESTMLNHLQQNVFVLGASKFKKIDDTVNIRLLKNPYEEIEYIAQDIITRVKTGKYRYNDFKLYYNNSDMYDTCIKRIFSQYAIPVYINSDKNYSNDSLVIFLNCLLRQLTQGFVGVSVENIIQMLKTGLTPFQMRDIYMFENYILEFEIKLYNFHKNLDKNNRDGITQSIVYNLDRINEIREYIYNLVNNLKRRLENITNTKEIAGILYDFLHESGILDMYLAQIQTIKKYDVDEFNKRSQIIKSIYEVMDNISIAFANLKFEEYAELYIYGLESMKIKSIPPFIDQVEVVNIDSTRSIPRKMVYVIGVFENGLPIIANTESFFSDKEIKELEALGVEIEKTTDIRNNMALFNVYKAINSCEEQLVFTIPSTKLTGENLRVSPLVWRIKDVITIDVEGSVSEEDLKKTLCLKNVYEKFVENLSVVDIDEKQNVTDAFLNYAVLMQDEKYSNVLSYTREIETLSKSSVNKLYRKDMYSSVSRLERFEACPFNYFANYVLKLKEKKEYKLSRLDLGSIMHKVLEDSSKFLLASNKGFEDVLNNEETLKMTKKQIDKNIDDIFESIYEKYLASARYAYLKNKLKRGMLNVIKYISQSFMQSEFRPLGFEVEFDNDKLFAPIEVELSNGKKMYLRGKIDRIDKAKLNETTYLRIVDYKSSGKDLKLSDVKDGVSIQLMTYMSALLENKKKIDDKTNVLPVAVSYFTLNTEILNLSECVDQTQISEMLIEKMKMKGIYLNDIEVLKKLDNKFTTPKYSYIDMNSRRLSNAEKSLNEERFLEECNNMKDILKQIADEMVTGKTAPSKKENSCKYCSYVGICKKALKSM